MTERKGLKPDRGETVGLDAKRESPVGGNADAPKTLGLTTEGRLRDALERIAGSWTQFTDEPGNALASGYKTQRDMMQKIAAQALASSPPSSEAGAMTTPDALREAEKAIDWLIMFADMRSSDSQRVAAKVQRGAMQTISDRLAKLRALLALTNQKPSARNAVSARWNGACGMTDGNREIEQGLRASGFDAAADHFVELSCPKDKREAVARIIDPDIMSDLACDQLGIGKTYRPVLRDKLLTKADAILALTTTPLAVEVRPSGDMVKSAVHCLRDLAYQLEQWARLAAITPRQRKRVVEIADEADRRARDLLSGTGEAPTPSNIGDAEAREALADGGKLRAAPPSPPMSEMERMAAIAEVRAKLQAEYADLNRKSGDGWQDFSSAPKNGTCILAIVAPDRGRYLEHHAGRAFVIRHEGETSSGYDMGWAVYPGFGGASDHDFTHWLPLPNPPKATCTSPVGDEK